MTMYTVDDWLVQPGAEQEFLDAWREFAARTVEEDPGARIRLLADRDEMLRYVGILEWADERAAEEWRGSDEFQRWLIRMRRIVEYFETHVFDEAAAP
jgi:heme-degrading monooxygenase HmoA